MNYPFLDYIKSFDFKKVPPTYLWDDTNSETAEALIDKNLLLVLRSSSIQVMGPLTCILAEWLIHRFDELTNTELAKRWVEAGWAGFDNIQNIGKTWEEVRVLDEWRGPLRGPINLAMSHVQWGLEDSVDPDGGDPALNTVRLAALVKYTLPESSEFDTWQQKILERIQNYQKSFETSPPLPPDFFDPSIPVADIKVRNYHASFSKELDFIHNPFLK